MQKVIIIGGGLAGLSSAVQLAAKNIPVEVIEASGRLGGRVTSFYDPGLGQEIDNGQHIMMGCYGSTLEYLRMINAEQYFSFQESIEVNFLKQGRIYPLKADKGLYPFNFIKAVLSFKLLSFKERMMLLSFFLMLPLSSERDIENLDAEQWLSQTQSENIRRSFWDIFIIGALNTVPSKASALLLRSVLFKVFFGGRKASAIILPLKPLTEAFCKPAVKFLEVHNSEVHCSERVVKIEADRGNNKIIRIVTSRRIISDFSFVICAAPLFALNKLIRISDLPRYRYSPILNFCFITGKKLFPEEFIALIGSPIQWIFRHDSCYYAVISSADSLVDNKPSALIKLLTDELKKQFSIAENDLTAVRVIKERRATYIPSLDVIGKRPGNITKYKNLVMAGDWTETGLPATIEAAVESGKRAARAIIK